MEPLRVLMLEDAPTDAELIAHELHRAGVDFTSLRVDTRDAFVDALEAFRPDIILSDYKLPGFDGISALQIAQREHPEVPVIMVTGALSDTDAVELIHAGAKDYVLKDRLARLAPAVKRALSAEQGIRARKAAEIALQQSETELRAIVEYSPVAMLVDVGIDQDERVVLLNQQFTRLFGYTIADVPDVRHWWPLAYPDQKYLEGVRAEWLQRVEKAVQNRSVIEPMEVTVICKDGSSRYVRVALASIGSRNIITFEDLTERKRAESAVMHANRALATLSAVNRNLVSATSEGELLQAICDAIVRQHGYLLAWVGYVQHDEQQSIRIMAHAGEDAGYLDAMQLTWAETARGQGPSGRAVRSGTTQLCQDIASDPRSLPWREQALERGYASSIALTLKDEGGAVFGLLTVYAEEAQAYTRDEIELLEEMAGDLAFGVHTLRTRQERDLALEKIRQQVVQLQDSLEDSVRAIATIVEMRDPYTAGHQARVADLAGSIAQLMGLPDEEVHAIRLAGTVHDVGKIQIPAEILSKPGKLSDIEFALIKTHPQAGYDILKDIDFPWPIAQMVLQHHERMDGSGYPQGLAGDQILPGARILSVADVVEAISSHRPYRASLGGEAALDEITLQRGTSFDPEVVDACLALFRERGYRFPA